MGHAAALVVDLGATQVFHAHLFARHGLYDLGAGDKHVAGLVDHKDKVGDGRAVDRAAGAGPHDDRYLGDDARGQGVAGENLAIGPQRVHAFLDARAARVIDADHRGAVLQGQVQDLAHFGAVDIADRAALNGKVLGKDIDRAPVDCAPACDHALRREFVGAAGGKGVQFVKAARVEQQVDALASGQFAFVVLALDARDATAQAGGLFHFQKSVCRITRIGLHSCPPKRVCPMCEWCVPESLSWGHGYIDLCDVVVDCFCLM